MNGPEHYAEAERLASPSQDQVSRALVHAVLALAAATVDAATDCCHTSAWGEVTS
jgi:hypothetical protein